LVAAVDHLVAIARLRPDDHQAQYAAGNALRAIRCEYINNTVGREKLRK